MPKPGYVYETTVLVHAFNEMTGEQSPAGGERRIHGNRHCDRHPVTVSDVRKQGGQHEQNDAGQQALPAVAAAH